MQEKKREKNVQTMKKLICKNELPKNVIHSMTKEQFYQYQIWDGIVKRLAFTHPRLLLSVIKELFHKDYSNDVKIEFLSVEYILDDLQRNKTRKLRTIRADIVIGIDDADIFHFECQIRREAHMVLRMYEYDTQVAVLYGLKGKKGKKRDVVSFPQSVIMYLTHTSNTPDEEIQSVEFPNGQSVEYTVPVMKIQDYTLEMIADKKLYYILPLTTHRFYNYKNHKCDIELLTEYVKESMLIINEAVNNGDLTESEGSDIMGYVMYSIENMTIEEELELRKKIFSTVPESLKLPWEKVEDLQADKEDSIKKYIEIEKEEDDREACSAKLQKIFGLSDDQAKEKMDLYWPE